MLDKLKSDFPLGELLAAAGQTVTASGLGPEAALTIFEEVLAPACISIDHPRYLSFVPGAQAAKTTGEADVLLLLAERRDDLALGGDAPGGLAESHAGKVERRKAFAVRGQPGEIEVDRRHQRTIARFDRIWRPAQ